MGGKCDGVDYDYMTHNCPQTCSLCDRAKGIWEKQEAERRQNPTYEGEDSKVVVLDGDTIDDFTDSECVTNLCLIEFFAPWCGHCQQVAPAFREAAKLLHEASEEGKIPIPVKLAKYDDSAEENKEYQAADKAKWNFTSYPSMYIVGGAPSEGEDRLYEAPKHRYWGGSEQAEEIVHHMTSLSNGLNQTQALDAFNDVEKRTKPGFYKEGGKHFSAAVTELDHDNFVETVLHSDALWIIEYYSDKCPICNTLAPSMIKAAEKLKEDFHGKVRLGAINSRVYHDILATPYEVLSYPWVTSFYLGDKVEDMSGLGEWESIYNFGKSKFESIYKEGSPINKDATVPPPPPPKKEGEENKDEEALDKDEGEKQDEL